MRRHHRHLRHPLTAARSFLRPPPLLDVSISIASPYPFLIHINVLLSILFAVFPTHQDGEYKTSTTIR